jgi:L-threonylcarbamoyladenylate synthase
MLKSHYSPIAKVYLNIKVKPGNGLIAMSNFPTPPGAIRLAAPHNLNEYAKVLYSSLREADNKGIPIVVAIVPTGEGLATAIHDRLTKASIQIASDES